MNFRSNQWADAASMVEKHHYSGRVPSNVQFIGSLHVDGGLFGDFGEIVAAAFFSIPPTRWSEDVIELSRLVRADERVHLSHLIAMSLAHLKRNGHKLIVSFADRTQGHFGGVYQACSWNYAGCRERRMDGVIVDGTFVPGRSANSRWGTQSPSKLATLGVDAKPHYDEGKHLYWKPLGVAGKTRAKRLGLQSLPYPANGPEDELTPVSARQVRPLPFAPDTPEADA